MGLVVSREVRLGGLSVMQAGQLLGSSNLDAHAEGPHLIHIQYTLAPVRLFIITR